MKLRTQFPVDLMMLLLAPVFVVTVIGVMTNCALSFFSWLMAHR